MDAGSGHFYFWRYLHITSLAELLAALKAIKQKVR